MFPYSTPYNPYQSPDFPVPNVFGEFPATLSYNGRLFARRDHLQSAEPATNALPIPNPNIYQQSERQHTQTSVQGQSGHVNALSHSANPNPVQQNNSGDRLVPSIEPNQQVALSSAVQQPQHLPAVRPPQWPFYSVPPQNLVQNTTPLYNQPPFFTPQQVAPIPAIQQQTPLGVINPYLGGGNVPQQQSSQSLNPHSLIATNLRHKCGICGKSRSARYHHENPIHPGRSPAPTICGKCRKRQARVTGPAGESADNSSKQGHRRHRSPWRRGAERASNILHSHARRRERSKSERVHESGGYGSSSDTLSSESDRGRPKSVPHRARSSDVEMARYIKAPRSNARSTRGRTVFVESVSSEDDDEPIRYHRQHDPHYARSEKMPSRSCTPRPPTIYRGHSFHAMPSPGRPHRQDHTHNFVDDNAYHVHTHLPHATSHIYSRSSNVSPIRYRDSRAEGRVIGTIHSQEDSDNVEEKKGPYTTRHNAYDGEDDDNVVEVHEVISRDASPSVLSQTSQTGRHHQPRNDRGDKVRVVRHLPAVNRCLARTARSPLPSTGKSHHKGLMEDYDWYDQDGMRVRVREI